MRKELYRIAPPGRGFTLIELLVVISIISVLASMLLPSLGRGKQKAIAIRCLNNVRQLSIGVQLYVDDYRGKFPLNRGVDPLDSRSTPMQALFSGHLLGGREPRADFAVVALMPKDRPLFLYVAPSEVYRCAQDKGQRLRPCYSTLTQKPSNWETMGCSYDYNGGRPDVVSGGGFKEGFLSGLAGQSEGWVADPVRHILLHEPPARLYTCVVAEWGQWHYSRGITDFGDPQRAPAQFISPVAFVDGHAAIHNFSKSLQTDVYYPYEATKDWVWYKPAK
jgi:prepilin-type N-terminal cleavage/methylation domain-containing protein